MKKNHTISEIRLALSKARSILILPHVKADGDAVGSSSALVNILRKAGKEVFALGAEEVPEPLQVLALDGYVSELPEDFQPELLIAVDCADESRFADRSKDFPGLPLINFDHHLTNTRYGKVAYVSGGLSSTGELIYTLFHSMGYKIGKKASRSLLGAILLDTNRFYYSSVGTRTLEVAAEIIERGVDMAELNEQLFGQNPKEKMLLLAKAIERAEFFAGGRGVYCYLPSSVQEAAGTENTDDIVEALRDIQGVEVAMLLYEYKGTLRASLRSFGDKNVAKIAQRLGGGGHKNAAGITFTSGNAEKALASLLKPLEALFAGKN